MHAISRILCPVDLSDPSRRALRQALALARQYQATVRVVQVVDTALPPDAAGGPLLQITPEIRTTLEEGLHWFVAPVLDPELTVTVQLREGPVVSAILAEAALMRADLIVVGTHGRSGFERLALGSVAEKLLRRADCPVLCVPHGEGASAPVAIRRVLCPTDFSAASVAAADYARFVALTSGASLSLVTVVEWPFGETTGRDAVADLRRSIEADAESHLHALASGGGPPAETFVLRGKPWREITAFARTHKTGLIVMGLSGRGAIDLALLGSTTHHVVREAPCPVLTVPAGARSS